MRTAKRKKTALVVSSLVAICFLIGACAQDSKQLKDEQVSKPAEAEAVKEPVLYTAYNIWKHKPRSMWCINYKVGYDIIPAGTEVKDAQVYRPAIGRPTIRFTTVSDGREFRIYFNPNWHPGKTIEDYEKNMFSIKTFDQLTAGMSEKEIDAIKRGVVVNGMSKDAVLVSYGPPAEHETPSLEDNSWLYWTTRIIRKRICFDETGHTTTCH